MVLHILTTEKKALEKKKKKRLDEILQLDYLKTLEPLKLNYWIIFSSICTTKANNKAKNNRLYM